MPSLSIRLLGPFEVTLDGQPATPFASDKVRALLAYLAVEAGSPHRREAVAGLLWPEMPEATARANVRYALANLRQVIADRDVEDPIVWATRQTIQFNPGDDVYVDVQNFVELLGGGQLRGKTVTQLEQAVGLVRGSFLHGFTLKDAFGFEEWLLLQREHLARLHFSALHRLAEYYEGQGALDTALRYAWQQVELEPFEETAQQQLLRLLALSGQRSSAVAHYEVLRQLLADELGVEPSADMRSLYRQILSGELAPAKQEKREGIIRGYDLLAQIGGGTFGAVYRAHQPVLGRQVAVKVILPKYANQAGFIRRFEAEAQMVAQLEHMHIVPLYDFWREPAGAYLVMRLFPEGSLKDRLVRGPMAPEAVARVADQVASALAVAHNQGVFHRDVKPANILLDSAGNAYLSDFSIARGSGGLRAEPAPKTLTVSPEYAAPEQWYGAPLTPMVDIYSLGMVLYELLTGVHPFSGASGRDLGELHTGAPLPQAGDARPELPPAVDDVLQQATAKSPRDRFGDAFGLAEAFRQAIQPSAGQPVRPALSIARAEPSNPYKGLRPFREADAPNFFGRDALVGRLLRRLAAPSGMGNGDGGSESRVRSPGGPGEGEGAASGRFLAVVGPSGSGKSSLVHAGLLPALRQGALPGSEGWFIAKLQPGTRPMEELEAAILGVASRGEGRLREALAGQDGALQRAVEAVLPEGAELLVVVDQFEELYAPDVDAGERERFLEVLCSGVTAPNSATRVVITLRADFYDRPLRHTRLSHLMQRQTEVVVPLTAEEAAEAVSGPARRVGIELEPGLVQAIVEEVAEQPGALPAFQYALTELFERRRDRLLTWDAYRESGGVTGALARRAEEIYTNLDRLAQALSRQLFLRLVTPGEGTEDTRRRVSLEELLALRVPGGLDAEERTAEGQSAGNAAPDRPAPVRASADTLREVSNTLLELFGQARLLLFDRDPATRAPTVEVAHEALLTAWHRLRDWLQVSWSDLRMQRLLAQASDEWLEANCDDGFLLRGTRLAQFEGWACQSSVALTREEGTYLEASVVAHRAREEKRETRRQRELAAARALADEQQKRAEDQAASARRLGRRAMYLAGALLLAVVLAVAAGAFARRANDNANLAATRELEALANADLAATGQALAAERQGTAEAEAVMRATAQAAAEAEAALRATAQSEAEAETALRGTAQAEAEAEARLRATAQADALAGERAAEEQARLARSRELAAGALNAMATDPELAVLLALHALDEAETAEAENALHATVPGLRQLRAFSGHSAGITGLSLSADGAYLATAGKDGTARVWDMESGVELLSVDHPGPVSCIALDPAAAHLATGGDDGLLSIWQISASEPVSAQLVLTVTARPEWLVDVAFSPDGLLLSAIGRSGAAGVWDARSGGQLMSMPARPAGQGGSSVWTVRPADVEFSPDGAYLATATSEESVRVWDVSALDGVPSGGSNPLDVAVAPAGPLLELSPRPAGSVSAVAFSSDSAFLATAQGRGKSDIWNVAPGEAQGRAVVSIPQPGESLAFSPDGMRLAIVDSEGRVHLRDPQLGREVMALPPHPSAWLLAYAPDGNRLVTAGEDGFARLWAMNPPSEILALSGTSVGVVFARGGENLITGSKSGVQVWDIDTGQPLLSMDGHERGVMSIALSPDGRCLATAGNDRTARIWQLDTGEEMLALAAHDMAVWDVDFSGDCSLLATAGADGMAKVWDAVTGRQVMTLTGHADVVHSVSFDPSGRWLATGSRDRTVRLWDIGGATGEHHGATEQTGGAHRTMLRHGVQDVVFSPDGSLLAAGDRAGEARLWRVSSGELELEHVLDAHTSAVTRLAFDPQGRWLATAGYDRVAKVWDAATGRELHAFTLSEFTINSIDFSPDSRYLATSGGGITRIYALRLHDLIAIAGERLTRSLTDRECSQYLHRDVCP